jgi:hypothetical protein
MASDAGKTTFRKNALGLMLGCKATIQDVLRVTAAD